MMLVTHTTAPVIIALLMVEVVVAGDNDGAGLTYDAALCNVMMMPVINNYRTIYMEPYNLGSIQIGTIDIW